jgi:hypothetical protein
MRLLMTQEQILSLSTRAIFAPVSVLNSPIRLPQLRRGF